VIRPHTKETRKITMNKKKSTLAMSVAPEAIPPKPKIAAMIATMKNPSAQRNIGFLLSGIASPDDAIPTIPPAQNRCGMYPMRTRIRMINNRRPRPPLGA
jgi:hypothetical protein